MELHIPRKCGYRFSRLLINKMYRDVMRDFRVSKSNKLENYLDEQFGLNIHTKDLLRECLVSLQIQEKTDYLRIYIDPNKKYKNTDLTVKNLVNFVTYGNADIKGYPIVLDEFKKISKNLNTYYKTYKITGVLV